MTPILIIDDDELFREMLRQTLVGAGYEVAEASDGNKGVRQFRELSPQLVLTDIVMPDKEGLETIQELRGIDPNIKIIAMSGGGRLGPEGYLKVAERLRVNRTFEKPLDRQALLAAVVELVGYPQATPAE